MREGPRSYIAGFLQDTGYLGREAALAKFP